MLGFQARMARGIHKPIDPVLLPSVWLVWLDKPSNSGCLHSIVKGRSLAGDEPVQQGMQRVAACWEQGQVRSSPVCMPLVY
jgi:glucuronokinase